MTPFVKAVLSEVADWFRGDGMVYISHDAKDPHCWATLVILAILVVPALVAARIVEACL
ncbi:hypothetical protein ACFOY2_05175 [Nonomuraea purpurea]|uniref:Uncharacterized protein n=1 Tax=Nonomuraea purpurea TaxID=1849276 RepID=A0ABV8FXZ3_9ACTN